MTSSDRDSRDPPGEPDPGDHDSTDRERSRDSDPGDHADVAQFSVPEMDCPSCAGKVESSVRKLDGVDDVDPQVATGTLTVSYAGDSATADDIADRVEKAGYSVESVDETTARFTVPEMDCASCAGKVENAVSGLGGVSTVDPRPTTGTLVVTYDSSALSDAEIVDAIERAGYEVTDSSAASDGVDAAGDDRESIWTSPRAIKTWISGVFAVLGLLFEFLLTGQNGQLATVLGSELLLADVLFLLAVATGGQAILRNGYYSARNRNLDIDFLMSTAILGALLASLGFGEALYFEAATLAFLFSVAELLERYSMDRARNSLRELMDLSPDEATVKRDGREETVPVEEVTVGDVVVVRPGEKIPTDGEVADGESAVNQAPITGESVPVDKVEGDEVYAGTINEEGYLEVRVTSAAGEDTLSRIVEMVEDAQANKTEREQFVERFSAYYTPVVVAFAVLVTLASPSLLGTTWATSFVYGLTLLVLACPCAFVIS
uniref:heavy metal translocating P-type ATPase n=1 Tax=Halobellus rufus TaxID=1448860 RepID=UPI0012DFF67E